jgi:hypothetical protein
MVQVDRGRIATALVLILLGAWFLTVQLVPGLQAFAFSRESWPLAIVALGLVFAVIGLVTWVPGLLVPASIIGGIGILLYWQNLTDNWESWAYAWTLIPGFVGVGVFLSELMHGRVREALTGGGWLILISAIMFLIFGSFLGGPLLLGAYWPVLLILLGVIFLVQALVRSR